MAEPTSYSQMAYGAIKDDIISQKLKPGSFISEAEYAAKIGISRTPVREALKTLEREGLLDIYPRKGVQIKNFSLEEIVQIHEATEAVESAMMAYIAERSRQGKLDREKLDAVKNLLVQMDKHLADNSQRKWLSCDHQFHNQLIGLCDNPYIVDYAAASRNRMNLTLWFVTPQYADKTQSTLDHKALVDAIDRGDEAAAREAAKMHILRVRKNMVESMGL